MDTNGTAQCQSLQSECYFNLGQLHQHGLGVDQDHKTALRYYRKAAALGNNPKSYSRCGDYYYSHGDKKTAMNCYKKAAELGDINAFNNIGIMLENGYGDVAPNAKMAVQNYKEAHSKGNTDASINLALFFINGQFQPKDMEQGKNFLLHAY